MNNSDEPIDSEYTILETLYLSQKRDRDIKQRELSQAANLSLGMTNTILKRFAGKGWITIRKFNSRNISYAVTPEGVSEIARRAFRYFKRTINNVSVYREMIEDTLVRRKKAGYTGVLLAGSSDLEFIVEYACQKYELLFMKVADPATRHRRLLSGKFLYLVSENVEVPKDGVPEDTIYLVRVFSGSEAVGVIGDAGASPATALDADGGMMMADNRA